MQSNLKEELLKAKVKVLQIALYFVFASVALGLSVFALAYSIENYFYRTNRECTDTQCVVQIINGVCFARLAELDNSQFVAVKCDKKRTGTYNTTLPCDIDKYGEYEINCNKMGENTKMVVLHFFALLFTMISGVAFLSTMIILFSVGFNYWEIYKLYQVENNSYKSATKMDNFGNSTQPNSKYVELEEISKN